MVIAHVCKGEYGDNDKNHRKNNRRIPFYGLQSPQRQPLVADLTAERIRKAAQQLDYLPSAAARSLKTKRTHVLGVILSGIADPFFSEVLNGIEGAAHAAGYSLFIGSSNHDADKEARIVQTMLEQRIDGGIICSTPVSIERWRQFPTDRFPIVVVNNQAADHYNFSIYHDDIDGSRQLARHLIELGHKDIAYLGNSHSGKPPRPVERSARRNGIPWSVCFPDHIHYVPGGSLQMGAEGMNYFLSLPNPPTAVMCFNDMLAIGALKPAARLAFAPRMRFPSPALTISPSLNSQCPH